MTLTDESGATTQVPLTGDRLLIGRSPNSHVVLADDRVSRHHAELSRDAFGVWWVRDLGSSNGTQVNGQSIERVKLEPGDRIEVGKTHLVFGEPAHREVADDASLTATVALDTATTHALAASSPGIDGEHLSSLLAFTQELIGLADEPQRLQTLCRLMVQGAFRGRWATVIRVAVNQAQTPAVVLAQASTPGENPNGEPPVSRSMLEHVMRHGEPALGSNAPLGDVHVELTTPSTVPAMSVLACPLRRDTAQHTLDLLYVVLPPECGTTGWLVLAALACEKHQLAERVWTHRLEAEARAAIDRDLQRAREIQWRQVPQDVSIAGLDVGICFDPSFWVGGDYIEVMPTPDGRVFAAVADVCGKGLSAALISASIHSTVHVSLSAGVSLATMMHALDQYLCEHLPEGTFVTMQAVLIDLAAGEVESVNAGHPAAAVLAPNGETRDLESCVNRLLGLQPGSFESRRHALRPGEMLALFTDGWTELGASSREMLGRDGLIERLRGIYTGADRPAAAEVAARMRAWLDEIEGGNVTQDDRTLLLVRRA